LGEDLPRNWSPAFRQKGLCGGLVCAEYVYVLIPIAGDDLGNGVAILRELPGGLEQARQRLVAKAVRSVLPQPDSARDRNSEAATLRHLAHIQESLDSDGPRSLA
jgi:hypothetical protein